MSYFSWSTLIFAFGLWEIGTLNTSTSSRSQFLIGWYIIKFIGCPDRKNYKKYSFLRIHSCYFRWYCVFYKNWINFGIVKLLETFLCFLNDTICFVVQLFHLSIFNEKLTIYSNKWLRFDFNQNLTKRHIFTRLMARLSLFLWRF